MLHLERRVGGLVVLFLLLGVGESPAQKTAKTPAKEDTVRVTTNVELVLPQKWYNEIWSAILKEAYEVKVRTKDGMKSWKGTFDRVAGYKDPRTNSTTYLYRIRQTFTEPGEYVIEKVFSGRGEEGPPVVRRQSWNVVVTYPTLAGPLNKDTYYFPGEKPMIAFATREFPEATGYRYEILQGGRVVKSGTGSNVFLDSLVNDVRSVGKDYEVRGYYRDSLFSYLVDGDQSVHTSRWQFKIRKPGPDMANLWCVDDTTKKENLPLLPMKLNAAYNPREFNFMYYGNKANALILSKARISGLEVTSDPTDFLAGQPTVDIGPVWTVVTITPSEAFLQKGRKNQAKYVELTFTYDTQYDKRVVRKFRANVY
jgi:hypothetical protein